jgi:hypothetical protein
MGLAEFARPPLPNPDPVPELFLEIEVSERPWEEPGK